jgi:hypothetical protein
MTDSVPNIAHFIWITGPKSRPFSYLNMLAVMAAKTYGGFDKIFMHNNKPPEGNPHWDRASEFFEIVEASPPRWVSGIPLEYVQYQSDVMRLDVMIENGGFYLDTDTFVLRNMSQFRNRDLTLCRESPDSIAMAPIIAKPGSRFLALWQATIPDYMKSGKWASHAVNLPHDLAIRYPDQCTVMSQDLFFPLDLKHNYLLMDARQNIAEFKKLFNCYAIHAYETYFRGQFDHIDDAHMIKYESILSLLLGDLIRSQPRYSSQQTG